MSSVQVSQLALFIPQASLGTEVVALDFDLVGGTISVVLDVGMVEPLVMGPSVVFPFFSDVEAPVVTDGVGGNAVVLFFSCVVEGTVLGASVVGLEVCLAVVVPSEVTLSVVVAPVLGTVEVFSPVVEA